MDESKWYSRRLLVALALIAASTVIYVTDGMTVDQWTEFNQWVGLGYIGQQGIQDAVKSFKEK